MTPAARRVLELRQALAKSSVNKLKAFADRVGPDGRLRHEFLYAGAHTLRWSSRGVQIHNLKRPTLKDDAYDAAVDAIRAGHPPGGSVQNVVSSTLRAAFRAPDGYHFVVADLSQIELRVLAWLSNDPRLCEVFALGRDPYIDFAARWLKKLYDDVTKDERQNAKPGMIQCGYGSGGGEEKVDDNGDTYKTGLWGFAHSIGVPLTQQQAHEIVTAYRDIYREVPKLWYALFDAVVRAIGYGDQTTVGKVTIGAVTNKLLWIALPSGRRMHYPRPRIHEGCKATYAGYLGKSAVIKKLYGGLVAENLCQSISRDCLAEGMLAADAAGFTLVGHVHDEVIALERVDDTEHTLERLCGLLSAPLPWAPDLRVAAEGFCGTIYRK
jgi:DNA polymerase